MNDPYHGDNIDALTAKIGVVIDAWSRVAKHEGVLYF